MTMSSPAESSRPDGRTLTYGEAVFEATRSEMARDPSVFVMGQGVDDARGMFGTTLGLHKEFGPERSFDVPLAEDAMTGVGIGAALMGMRPIQVHQRMDFVLLCMNQLVNMLGSRRWQATAPRQTVNPPRRAQARASSRPERWWTATSSPRRSARAAWAPSTKPSISASGDPSP